jgi:anti-anti-sigma factor
MSRLDLKTDYFGELARVTCSGRIAVGPETEQLDAVLQKLMREVETIDLDLEGVNFLDSSGIGVLVRNLIRAREQSKVLRLAALSPQVRKTLEITSVIGQFRSPQADTAQINPGLRVLFVHPSAEVRTFVTSLLKTRGAMVDSCASGYDARLLMSSGDVDVIVVCTESKTEVLTPSGASKVTLPADFFHRSGDEVAQALVAAIKGAIISTVPSSRGQQ